MESGVYAILIFFGSLVSLISHAILPGLDNEVKKNGKDLDGKRAAGSTWYSMNLELLSLSALRSRV